jgi:hypothetical protein
MWTSLLKGEWTTFLRTDYLPNSRGFMEEPEAEADEMTENQEERFVVAFELIASSLKGLHEELRRAGYRYWAQPREQKEAVVSRVESDDERSRRNQGARRRTIEEVIDPNADEEDSEEYVGERTRQWLRDHPKEAKKEPNARPEVGPKESGTGVATIEDQA